MALARWDPFREMMTLRDAMNQLFEESFIRPRELYETSGGFRSGRTSSSAKTAMR